MAVYSKKYLAWILAVLVGIAAVVFGASQWFVSQDTPERVESVVGEPVTGMPTSAPYVDPPESPPPGY